MSADLSNFDFERGTKICFGKGKVKSELGNCLKRFGATKVLITYGRTAIKKIGLYDEIIEILKKENIQYWECDEIRPNPEVASARKAQKICKEHDIDFLLAVGGGSVIDMTKLISSAAYYDKDPWDIVKHAFDGQVKIKKYLPIGTILTMPASASEYNDGAVISNDETKQKLPLFQPPSLPKFSILDPTYTFSLSDYQTRAGIFDMFSHLEEQYFSDKNPFMPQRMIEGMIKTLFHYLPIVLKDPKNYEARSNLMWTASIALNGLPSAGRDGGDWSNHMMEHEASALYPELTHGMGLCIITMGWMRYVVEKRHDRFIQFGKNVLDMKDLKDTKEDAIKVIDHLEEFFRSNGYPTYFTENEATKNFTVEDAKKCAANRTKNGGPVLGQYVVLDEKAQEEILVSRVKKE